MPNYAKYYAKIKALQLRRNSAFFSYSTKDNSGEKWQNYGSVINSALSLSGTFITENNVTVYFNGKNPFL